MKRRVALALLDLLQLFISTFFQRENQIMLLWGEYDGIGFYRGCAPPIAGNIALHSLFGATVDDPHCHHTFESEI